MKRIFQYAVISLLLVSSSWAQTADVHYRQGMRELADGDIKTATEEFRTARHLDQKFAPAYVGLALVEMENGNLVGAHELLKTAGKYDKKLVDVYLAKSRLYARTQRKDWQKKALKELKRAEKIDGKDDRVSYHRGMIYRQIGAFEDAAQAFAASVAHKGHMCDDATRAQHEVQLILRALPETERAGKQVVLASVATRGDLALLLLDEFGLKAWLQHHRPDTVDTAYHEYLSVAMPASDRQVSPKDIEKHPHRNVIVDVLKLDVPGLELYPDGYFRPQAPITRAEFAQIMQGLLAMALEEPDLATRYFGETSRFSDLRSDHFAYNAAVVCIQRGILAPRSDGRFGSDEPVSGAEAVLGMKLVLAQ